MLSKSNFKRLLQAIVITGLKIEFLSSSSVSSPLFCLRHNKINTTTKFFYSFMLFTVGGVMSSSGWEERDATRVEPFKVDYIANIRIGIKCCFSLLVEETGREISGRDRSIKFNRKLLSLPQVIFQSAL